MTVSRDEYVRASAEAMHETNDFTPAVIRVAHQWGWLVEHSRPARTADGWRTAIAGDAGGPDLKMCHPKHGVLWAELKAQKGRLSDGQKVWFDVLTGLSQQGGTFRYRLWRPLDLLDGTIGQTLKGE